MLHSHTNWTRTLANLLTQGIAWKEYPKHPGLIAGGKNWVSFPGLPGIDTTDKLHCNTHFVIYTQLGKLTQEKFMWSTVLTKFFPREATDQGKKVSWSWVSKKLGCSLELTFLQNFYKLTLNNYTSLWQKAYYLPLN